MSSTSSRTPGLEAAHRRDQLRFGRRDVVVEQQVAGALPLRRRDDAGDGHGRLGDGRARQLARQRRAAGAGEDEAVLRVGGVRVEGRVQPVDAGVVGRIGAGAVHADELVAPRQPASSAGLPGSMKAMRICRGGVALVSFHSMP
jgi:hypothetical protein